MIDLVMWNQQLREGLTIITAPQKKTIEARKIRGPMFLIRTVAGGWKIAYGKKKTTETMV